MLEVCGVLAMQGAFHKHMEMLEACGAQAIEVRSEADLARCQRLIIPGGESTAMQRLLTAVGMWEALRRAVAGGLPVFGTCAGMILLSSEIEGYPEQASLEALPLKVSRNAYGRQLASEVVELPLSSEHFAEEFLDFAAKQEGKLATGAALALHFIRAPLALEWGPEVQILIRRGEQALALQAGRALVCSFHPELSSSQLLHRYFLSL